MKLLVINPNSTQSMTDKIAQTARQAVPFGVAVIVQTNHAGPAAIQGVEDGLAAKQGLLDLVAHADADAIVIACFDDTALAEARALSHVPVIGIGEAAFHAAMMLGARYSVITTLAVSVPVIAANMVSYGLRPARVRASDVAVLELEHAGSQAETKISHEIACALAEDDAQAIVLGCAGMTDLATRLSARHQVPVIDGVSAACGIACVLAQLVAGH